MVFFSRFPLPWDDVVELSDDLSKWQQELDGLSESDADEWLCEEGLMDAEIRARVIKASSEFVHLETGTKCRIYPLVLYLNLQLFQQLVSGGRDLPDDAFAVKAGHRRAHCRKIVERLLGDYSDQTQMLFETLSPLARFDKRTFEFVCREFNIPLGFDAFHRLEDLSIVSNSEDGWLKLHSVIAEIIWEMVQKRRQDGIVERLSAFFANRARPEHPRDVDEEAGICLEEGF
jgi:hypothetical protein